MFNTGDWLVKLGIKPPLAMPCLFNESDTSHGVNLDKIEMTSLDDNDLVIDISDGSFQLSKNGSRDIFETIVIVKG